jgi:hypothetical protein
MFCSFRDFWSFFRRYFGHRQHLSIPPACMHQCICIRSLIHALPRNIIYIQYVVMPCLNMSVVSFNRAAVFSPPSFSVCVSLSVECVFSVSLSRSLSLSLSLSLCPCVHNRGRQQHNTYHPRPFVWCEKEVQGGDNAWPAYTEH